jgi:cyclopropane fatty-acyl-phospholipid synthase-like methyltransferase
VGILTVLDIPCGDFHWMRNVDLSKVEYIGADIVKEIIKNNKDRYEKSNITFLHMNLIEDPLPQVDLILMRDCLVHMSYDDIFKSLDNVCRSKSQYLLTTTFTGRQDNKDIVTGDWRTLNLQIAPFLFPKPIRIINEKCTQKKMSYTDKSLGLWKISDIVKILKHE